MIFSHSQDLASGSWLAPILRDRYYRILSISAVPQVRDDKTLEVPSEGALLGSCQPGPSLPVAGAQPRQLIILSEVKGKKRNSREGGQAGGGRLLLKEVIMY